VICGPPQNEQGRERYHFGDGVRAIHEKSQRLAYAALIAVCLFWGTTYLAIRIAVETIPPLYMISIRYMISGAILLIAAVIGGARLPRGRELFYTAICGIICIGIGNGFLAIVEKWTPSGLAALFYTTSPFWMVGIDSVLPGGRRPHGLTVAGLIVGICGVIYLVLPMARAEGLTGRAVTGFLLLQISGIGWALGALLQKRVRTQTAPFLNGAVQQFAAGLAVGVPAFFLEPFPHAVSTRSQLAVAYLVVFGSIVGFTSFIYSMARLPVALVSIYTFVNPIVAVFLGWLLLHERFGYREWIAMAIIFMGIALVRWSELNRSAALKFPTSGNADVIPVNE
jgi:drug/metabolite transporter (DMT)-like permease